MSKRGQVTVFIIVGVVVLFTFFAIIKFASDKEIISLQKTLLGAELEPVRVYAQSCFELATQKGLEKWGQRGGYYQTPPVYTYYFSTLIPVPVYFDREKIHLPTEEMITSELNRFIADEINQSCSFLYLEQQGYGFELGTLRVSSQITDFNVDVDISYPIAVTKDVKSSVLQDFTVSLVAPVRGMYVLASTVSLDQVDNDGLCISCMVELSEKYNVEVTEISNVETGTTVLQIKDSSSDNPLLFQFALYGDVYSSEGDIWS